ncbi:hypothetical protein BG005_001679 [Podila minutissima]|nr:hypothetical protein BG005_001679 [Podila minutissima]
MTSARSIELFCLVDGESASRAFPVTPSTDDSIGGLKDLIKAKKSPEFEDIAADKLTLWCVSIPIIDDDDENPILLNNVTSEKKKLSPATRLSKVFSEDLPEETIHIIVQRPPPAVDLNADTKFLVSVKGKDSKPWEWVANPSKATLEDFRQHINFRCCIPENDRRLIVIEHGTSPCFPDGGFERTLVDGTFRAMLRTYVTGRLKHIVVHLEFIPKGFSKFSLDEVHDRLGTNVFDPFPVEKTACITEESVSEVKTTLKLVTGFQQNAMQLDAALTTSDAWDSRSNSGPSVSYGIVTDGIKWEFIECRMIPKEATSRIHRPPIIRRTELPVKVDYENKDWPDKVEQVFEYILWFVGLMSQGIPSTKRTKGNGCLTNEP